MLFALWQCQACVALKGHLILRNFFQLLPLVLHEQLVQVSFQRVGGALLVRVATRTSHLSLTRRGLFEKVTNVVGRVFKRKKLVIA